MPVTLDLYGHPWSAPTREVRILCAELGIDYRFIEVKQAEAGDYLPEALNPACKVPMIDAGGFILGEAHAIVRYLAARHDTAGVWYPAEIDLRAKVDQWLDWQALRLGRLAAQLLRQRRFRPDAPDTAACAEAERLLGLILPELDMELKATPFVCGQRRRWPTSPSSAASITCAWPTSTWHLLTPWPPGSKPAPRARRGPAARIPCNSRH